MSVQSRPIDARPSDARQAQQAAVYDSDKFRVPFFYEARELLKYRFLVRNLIARDLKVRYKRSTIGFIWVMLNPLLTMLVLTIVFSKIFRFNLPHYPAYLLSGMLLWNLYAQGSSAAMASIQGGGHILRKLYVPPSAFVASAVGSAFVNYIFALGPMLLLSLGVGVTPSLNWLYLPIPALFTLMFTFGMGLIVAALVVFFNDTFEIYQVLINAYYFFTPIFYPPNLISDLPQPFATIAQLNPMYLYISSFRQIILDGQRPALDLLIPGFISAAVVLALGWFLFTRVEDKFAYHF